MKTTLYLVFFIFTFLLLIKNTHAFGVISPPLEDNTLILNGTYSTVFPMGIQNMDDEDITVKVEFSSDIASIDKTEFTIPAKTKRIPLDIKINLPSDAEPGDEFTVSYSFDRIKEKSDSGQITFTTGISGSFKVRLAGEPPLMVKIRRFFESNWTYCVGGGIGIIFLIAILTIIIHGKKNRAKTKELDLHNNLVLDSSDSIGWYI